MAESRYTFRRWMEQFEAAPPELRAVMMETRKAREGVERAQFLCRQSGLSGSEPLARAKQRLAEAERHEGEVRRAVLQAPAADPVEPVDLDEL